MELTENVTEESSFMVNGAGNDGPTNGQQVDVQGSPKDIATRSSRSGSLSSPAIGGSSDGKADAIISVGKF